jgi:uncharacterized iron-regulated membrane protein
MKKRLYSWHRWLGVLPCAAIFLWCVSGFSHPLMNWTQPRPKVRALPAHTLSGDNFNTALDAALKRNNIAEFKSLNIISFNNRTYYQIKTDDNAAPLYLDAQTGELLADGDQLYAVHVARGYLQDFQAKVTNVERLREFNDDYREINRLLPVYQITFDRADGMRAYVDTNGAKLSTLVNNTKYRLNWFFGFFHNWNFLPASDTVRLSFIVSFALLTFIAAMSGILVYGFFWTSFSKTANGANGRGWLRKYHRRIGIYVAITMLTFSFSGGFHALVKLRNNNADEKPRFVVARFAPAELAFPLSQALAGPEGPKNAGAVSLVRFQDAACYRITRADKKVEYINAATGERLNDSANNQYTRQLANSFSGLSEEQIASMTLVTKFDDEYGFAQKLLPVMKVQYNDAANTRYYVDPASGALAANFSDSGRSVENWTFSYIHKWHFLNPIGSIARDVVMMAFVSVNATVSGMGLVLFVMWFRPRRRLSRLTGRADSHGGEEELVAANLARVRTE